MKEICIEKEANAKKETITEEDVLKPVAGRDGRVGLSPEKMVGAWLAGGVGLLILVVTLLLVGGWLVIMWKAPSLSRVMLEDALNLYDSVVERSLVPIFTLLVGYLFGRGERDGYR